MDLNDLAERIEDGIEWGPPFPVAVPNDGASHLLFAQGCKLAGWSIRETTGSAAAVFRLWNGASAGGTQAAEVGLPIGADSTHSIPDGGLLCDSGMFIEAVSGAFQGAVWLRPRRQ